MRKLTPEQARAIENSARKKFWELAKAGCLMVVKTEGINNELAKLDWYSEAITELTAKPGDEEFCEGCEWWQNPKWRDVWRHFGNPESFECCHPDFKLGHCPIGRWE